MQQVPLSVNRMKGRTRRQPVFPFFSSSQSFQGGLSTTYNVKTACTTPVWTFATARSLHSSHFFLSYETFYTQGKVLSYHLAVNGPYLISMRIPAGSEESRSSRLLQTVFSADGYRICKIYFRQFYFVAQKSTK